MRKLTLRAVLDEHGDGVATLPEHTGGQLVGGTAHVDATNLQQLVSHLTDRHMCSSTAAFKIKCYKKDIYRTGNIKNI